MQKLAWRSIISIIIAKINASRHPKLLLFTWTAVHIMDSCSLTARGSLSASPQPCTRSRIPQGASCIPPDRVLFSQVLSAVPCSCNSIQGRLTTHPVTSTRVCPPPTDCRGSHQRWLMAGAAAIVYSSDQPLGYPSPGSGRSPISCLVSRPG